MPIFDALLHALVMALTMLWQIFWGLSLGFFFSAVIEVLVTKSTMSSLLPDASPKSLTVASLLGMVSSSCSYAAVAMARSIVRKGGDFTAAMAFQLAATNLVLELGVLLWVLLGWPFAIAELIGGPIMIIVFALLCRLFLKEGAKKAAIEQAKKGLAGSMEGHAAMSMGGQHGSGAQRLLSKTGWVTISHHYVMNWMMLWRDIGVGLLIAGALSAWVPDRFWQAFFMTQHPAVAMLWGAFVGPLIAVLSFTCSVGNVPLAAVLWRGGLSFGGVAAFIFGDLIILPILHIYKKYYGGKMTIFLAFAFYIAMVFAALLVEGIFQLGAWVPQQRAAAISATTISFNYTTVLDLIFGVVLVVLSTVFFCSGGPQMMKMMRDDKAGEGHHHEHMHHH